VGTAAGEEGDVKTNPFPYNASSSERYQNLLQSVGLVSSRGGAAPHVTATNGGKRRCRFRFAERRRGLYV
jgi:hypothetical protein